MVSLAQLVRASDCGSEGRGFDPHTSPQKTCRMQVFFCLNNCRFISKYFHIPKKFLIFAS